MSGRALLTIRETADLLNIGESSVRRMVRDGELPSMRIGRLIRIPADAIQLEPEEPPFEPEDTVYFIRSGKFVKIGFSRNVTYRMKHLQVGNPMKLELLHTINGNQEVEAEIHRILRHAHHRYEWFRYNTPVECFIDALIAGASIEEAKELL